MKKLSFLLLILISVAVIVFVFTLSKKDNENSQINSFNAPTAQSPVSASLTESESALIPTATREESEIREMQKIEITVNGKSFSASLCENEASKAFADLLPLTLEMSELNGNEKYCYLDSSLPADSKKPNKINSGDLMLYGSNCIVLFYDSFSTSYSYTPLCRVENPEGLNNALGNGGVTVSFRIQ